MQRILTYNMAVLNNSERSNPKEMEYVYYGAAVCLFNRAQDPVLGNRHVRTVISICCTDR